MKNRWTTLIIGLAFALLGSNISLGQQPQLVVQTGHTNTVSSVAFSPDGKMLASGGWDNTIVLWDLSTGLQLRALVGHTNAVLTVAFAPDGKTFRDG